MMRRLSSGGKQAAAARGFLSNQGRRDGGSGRGETPVGRADRSSSRPFRQRGGEPTRCEGRDCAPSFRESGPSVSAGTLRAIDLLPARNRRPDIVQSRLFTGLFHLQWGTPADKLFLMHLVRAPSCKRRGSGRRTRGQVFSSGLCQVHWDYWGGATGPA